MKKPKISIILTSHNRPVYLKQAIQSIFDQTLKNWELIIIDDFSTVNGVEDVLRWADKDKRVKVFHTEYDIDNISVLWNRGIDNSTGEYIALLDDDNKKFPGFCKTMSAWLDKNKRYEAVSCYAQILTGEKPTSVFDRPPKMTKQNIKYENYVDSGCMMFRRSVIKEIGWFDERLNTSEDWDFVKRIMLQTKYGFGHIKRRLSYYRWHGENRLKRAVSLGDQMNRTMIVEKKQYKRKVDVLLFHQDSDKLTLSQNNVLCGMLSAFKKIKTIDVTNIDINTLVKKGLNKMYDIVICFAPFSIDIEYLWRVKKYAIEFVSFHIEDPQAYGVNLIRAEIADYIFTNDESVIEKYEEIVGLGRCGFCPSVSFDNINLEIKKGGTKKYDAIFYGYAYESRKLFVRHLKEKLNMLGIKLTIVGGGWDIKNKDCIGELNQQDSIKIMKSSHVVILYNRKKTDLGGMPESIEPKSVVRGYFECGAGSLIMIDNCRPHHNLDGCVMFYNDINDLAIKIFYYVKNPKAGKKVAVCGQKKAMTEFTYLNRMTKLINIIRSQRYFAEIK